MLLAFDLEVFTSPSELPASAEFGSSVAIRQDCPTASGRSCFAAVGAPQDDEGGSNSGAVYVYDYSRDNDWQLSKRLLPEDLQTGDRFGRSVAIDHETIVVGSFLDDDQGMSSGSVYVFERDEDGWFQTDKLTASNAEAGALFGRSVAIDDDRIVVGAPYAKQGMTMTGAAYVYERNENGGWGEVEILTAADGALMDEFGTAVAISGDTIAVGAIRDDDRGEDSGSVYIFQAASAWRQTEKLSDPDGHAGDCFGFSLAMHDDTLVVGAFLHDGGGTDSGVAFVYDRSSAFHLSQTLAPSDRQAGAQFGHSVAIDGDLVIVGAPVDSAGSAQAGAAYVFQRMPLDDLAQNTTIEQSSTYSQIKRLTAASPDSGDRLGESVGIFSGTGPGSRVALVGALLDDNSLDTGSVRFFVDSADLEIRKTDSPDPVDAGGRLTYEITVTNEGPGPALDVRVTEKLPAGVTFDTSSVRCAPAPDDIECMLGDIHANAEPMTFSITVDVTRDAPSLITSTSIVSSETPDANRENNSATESTEVVSADLGVTLIDAPDPVSAGDLLSYTITVVNDGPSIAENVRVVAELPTDVTLVSTAGCETTPVREPERTTGAFSFATDRSPNNEQQVPVSAIHSSDAGVSWSAAVQDNTGNLDVNRDGFVSPQDALLVINYLNGPLANDESLYALALDVSGDDFVSPADALWIINHLNTPLTATASQQLQSTNICRLGTIPATGPERIKQYTITVRVAPATRGSISSTVGVLTDTVDPNLTNNSDAEITDVRSEVDLVASVEAPPSVISGTTVRYRLTFSNSGPSDAVGANILAAVPMGLTDVTYTSVTRGTVLGNTSSGSGSIDDTVNMSADSSITYIVAGFVQSFAVGAVEAGGGISAPPNTTDREPGNNTESKTITISPVADLTIDKRGPDEVRRGESLTYVIVVRNEGPSQVVGATVVDNFPSELERVSYTSIITGSVEGSTARGDGDINDTVTMAVGSEIEYTVTATVTAAAVGTFENTATVTVPQGTIDPSDENSSTISTEIIPIIR